MIARFGPCETHRGRRALHATRPLGRRAARSAAGLLAALALWLLAAGLGPAAPVSAEVAVERVEIEDVPFPVEVQASDRRLALHGLGLLRYRVLFRGYVGALYLPPGVPASRTLDDVPKALELRYFWDIEGRFFGEAADELLARSLSTDALAALRGRLDRLHALYRDVEVGDRYRLTYVPGEGTTLAYNGQSLGTIPGADFAAAYFGIWLGEAPLNESFRDQIFAGRR